MDVVLNRFLNMVETELNEKRVWMPEKERIEAAKLAIHIFIEGNCCTESSAVEDAVANCDGIMMNFEMKLTFRSGKLAVDYLDGTDIEVLEADSQDDVLEKVSNVITTAME